MCYETLAYEGMKPAKLKRHMETKHKESTGKPTGFFKRKRDELTQHTMKEAAQFFAPGKMLRLLRRHTRYPSWSLKMENLIQKGENLVKPAAKVMTNMLLGGNASDEINRIPLSNDTVQRRIKSMAESMEDQLVTRWR